MFGRSKVKFKETVAVDKECLKSLRWLVPMLRDNKMRIAARILEVFLEKYDG